MNEIWKQVMGYEGLYEVSHLGNVKSLDRTDNRGNKLNGKLLKQRFDGKGYINFCLSQNGEIKYYRAHRLLAQAFIPNPNNYKVIHHKDGNKINNHISNLEWTTQKQNIKYAIEKGTFSFPPISYGKTPGNAKLNIDKVREIVNLYNSKKYSQQKIADLYNVSQTAISHIILKTVWKNI